MGLSGSHISFKEFNRRYKSDIKNNSTECSLVDIGDEGLELFCRLKFNSLQIIFLNNNNISNIDCFKNLNLPLLIKLDLSYNKIKKIEVFTKVKYPLEELDLRYNIIDDISIFEQKKTLPKLKKLLLSNNDINFKDEKIKLILKNINEKLFRNNSNISSSESNNDDDNYKDFLKKFKTLISKSDIQDLIFREKSNGAGNFKHSQTRKS